MGVAVVVGPSPGTSPDAVNMAIHSRDHRIGSRVPAGGSQGRLDVSAMTGNGFPTAPEGGGIPR